MNMPTEGADFLIELKEFLNFLRKLWGMLASISVFFPLSNVFVRFIPLKTYGEEGGVYEHLSPPLITTITTIVALLPIMFLKGTGAEVMQPMAIPSIGGMTIEMITWFIVPTLYSWREEKKLANPRV